MIHQNITLRFHYHYVKECILVGDIDFRHIGTNKQTTDILTKALGANKLHKFSMSLGLQLVDTPSLCQLLEGEEPKIANLT